MEIELCCMESFTCSNPSLSSSMLQTWVPSRLEDGNYNVVDGSNSTSFDSTHPFRNPSTRRVLITHLKDCIHRIRQPLDMNHILPCRSGLSPRNLGSTNIDANIGDLAGVHRHHLSRVEILKDSRASVTVVVMIQGVSDSGTAT
jgi:hypothetical protein